MSVNEIENKYKNKTTKDFKEDLAELIGKEYL